MSLDELLELAGNAASEHAPFGERTTYRVGGTARLWLRVGSLDELRASSKVLRATGLPVVVFGNGSNLLVADGEFDGVVLELVGLFETLGWHDETDGTVEVEAGAALALPVGARRLADAGVVGFEWAVGVPGSFGGAAVMNAGGHGSDMAHSVTSVSTWNLATGELEEWTPERLAYGYRCSALRASDLVTSVTLRLRLGDAEGANQQIRDIVRWRRANQPGGSNAGSVFRNPEGAYAGELIERAGLKGRRVGSAHVSEKHANFFQVDADGRSGDVVDLMCIVRDEVQLQFDVTLQSELRLVGFEGRWP